MTPEERIAEHYRRDLSKRWVDHQRALRSDVTNFGHLCLGPGRCCNYKDPNPKNHEAGCPYMLALFDVECDQYPDLWSTLTQDEWEQLLGPVMAAMKKDRKQKR